MDKLTPPDGVKLEPLGGGYFAAACTDDDFYSDYRGTIDRNRVICTPIEINQNENKTYIQDLINEVLNNLCHSVGIFNTQKFMDSQF